MKKIKITDITPKSMKSAVLIKRLLYIDEVDSTNTYLLKSSGVYESGTAVLTLNQTSGRGRGGHVWDGHGCAAISVLIKDRPLSLLPLAAAAAAARTIAALTDATAKIKWPNDIIMNGKKLCGILCESRTTPSGGQAGVYVCGAGFNLSQSDEYFAPAGLFHASSIYAQTGRRINHATLASVFLAELEKSIKLTDIDSAALLNEYKKLCLTIGMEVKILPSGITGTAIDITRDGALVVQTGSGDVTVYGEVSVRGIDGGYI